MVTYHLSGVVFSHAMESPPERGRTIFSFSEYQTVNENLIEVLIFIYENYMDSDTDVPEDQILLEQELANAGFRKEEIKKAFDWLDELAWRQGSMAEHTSKNTLSTRVLTQQEQQRMDMETQGMLLYLEQTGILNPLTRELVIERAMALDTPDLEAEDVKWIVLLVLLNQPGQESAFALMEEMIYNGVPNLLH